MPIPCLPSETTFDVRCPVCDRAFLLLTEPTLAIGRNALRRAAERSLAAQHTAVSSWESAHPHEVFDLPNQEHEPGAKVSRSVLRSMLRFSFAI